MADNVLPPWWAGQEGTVFAEWDSWAGFPIVMPPDDWESNPPGLESPYAYPPPSETPQLLSTFEGRGGVIELNGDYELIFSMPNFGGSEEDSYKEIWIQVTYHPIDPNQYFWFAVEADIDGMSDEVFEDYVDHGDGWRTVALSCQIWPNPQSEEIALNFFNFVIDEPLYPAYVDQVVINTWCVPEPATIALLGLGSLLFSRKRRV